MTKAGEVTAVIANRAVRVIPRDKRGQWRLTAAAGRAPGPPRRVYVHIGEPKTGTTFLQDTLWTNRALLAGRGITLPGYNRRDHSRASRDLRDAPRDPSDVADPWAGEWDVLAGQALRAGSAAVISDEVLAAATPGQADRAVRSLLAAEVHLIVTVRSLAAVLPAEWQETVKCRGTLGWAAWVRSVVEAAPAADRRERSLFWVMHDTLEIIRMWSRHIPPGRVHVVTTPLRGPRELLWSRFAAVLGIDAEALDFSQSRANSSLGYTATEFLREVNEQFPADVPDWFYTRTIKRVLAHGVLSAQPGDGVPALPPDVQAWARQQSQSLCAALRDSGCHIVGDLGDLLPAQSGAASLAVARQPAGIVAAAVQSTAALAAELYAQVRPARPGRTPLGGPRHALSRLEWMVLHGRAVQWVLCRGSDLAVVRRLRVAIWGVLMRPARHRPSGPVGRGGVIDADRVSRAA